MKFPILGACVASAILASAGANAGFLGHTIEATAYFPTLPGSTVGGPVSAVVGAGTEFLDGQFTPFFGPSFDFADSTIVITHANTGHSSGTFNGYQFLDVLSTIAPIVNVTVLNDNSGFFSGDPSRVFFDSETIFVNFESLAFGSVSLPEITLQVTFGTDEVPEPTSLALIAAGLLGLGISRRRRVKAG